MANTYTIKGGAQLAKYLEKTAARLGKGGVVRVGYLEGARYPFQDKTARLRKGVEALSAVGPRKPGTGPKPGPHKQKLTAPLSVAQVGFWNEFGTATSPARPAIRITVKAKSPNWGKRMAALAKATNYDSAAILGGMGEVVQGQIKQTINSWPADNAPLTVAIKGFNKGLIDSSVMVRSVDYEVKKP